MTLGVGEHAPPFRLPDGDGVMRDLPRAPASIVYFTSNRCPSSLSWQPRIADVAEAYADRGVCVVAINVPIQFPGASGARFPFRDGLEGIRDVADRHEWRGILYLDGCDLRAARAWGAEVTPDLFVLDHESVVRYRGAPDESQFEPEYRAVWLRDALDAVLEKRKPPFVPTNLIGCPIRSNAPSKE